MDIRPRRILEYEILLKKKIKAEALLKRRAKIMNWGAEQKYKGVRVYRP